MKKLVIFVVVFAMLFSMTSFVYAERNPKVCPPIQNPNPEFYGNVYVWDKDAGSLWAIMNIVHLQGNGFAILPVKSTSLINKGEVINVRITMPLKYSAIGIYYEGNTYYFKLKPYLLGRRFILFTFSGDG